MSRRFRAAAVVFASLGSGCGYELSGWWELSRWDMEWPGGEASVQDAGILSWQDVGGGGDFDFALSYAFDADTRSFVPLAEPAEGSANPADGISSTYQGDDPILMTVLVGADGVQNQVVFTMDRYVGDRMELTGEAGDTDVRWTFVR